MWQVGGEERWYSRQKSQHMAKQEGGKVHLVFWLLDDSVLVEVGVR